MSTTRCDCVDRMDAQLAPHGVRVARAFQFSEDMSRMVDVLVVGTEPFVVDGKRRRSKGPIVAASHCPFCGAKWVFADEPRKRPSRTRPNAAEGDAHV